MADGQQPRNESGRFARAKPKPQQREHPCERLARTFNPPAGSAVMANRRPSASVEWGLDAARAADISWRHQFDDAMAVGLASTATGLPADLLLARWAGQDHRGLACRMVFAQMEDMGLSRGAHPARIAIAWVVAQVLAPPPRSLAERPYTFREHVLPPVTAREAARQARIRQSDFLLLARLARAVLNDMLRRLELAYCEARFAGF